MSASGSSSNRHHHLLNAIDTLHSYLSDPGSEIKHAYHSKLAQSINEFKQQFQSLDHYPYDSTEMMNDNESVANNKICEIMKDVFNFISISQPDELDPQPTPELSDELLMTFSCFFLMEEGAVIKKKELIYWWVGQGLIKDDEEDAEAAAQDILDKLVEVGVVEQLICSKRRKKVCKYKAIKGMINQEQQIKFGHQKVGMLKAQGSNFTGLIYPDGNSVDEKSIAKAGIERLYNRDVSIIDIPHEWLRKMRNNLKVLQLGRWSGDEADKKHIEVVNVELLLKCLKRMKKVRLISLRGISRIMEIGEEVCSLGDNLRVLDLQACPNLEVLPKGIGNLKNLTHLDLSECYLLDRIPKGISSLTKLQVLEGFVIGDVVTTSSCKFKDLATHLGKTLRKLSIRTRYVSFPLEEDLKAFAKFEKLLRLKVVWVRISDIEDDGEDNNSRSLVRNITMPFRREANALGLPEQLQKLEVGAIPQTAVKSLMWSSHHKLCKLKKLNILGGQVVDLTDQGKIKWDMVETLQLKYLTNLHMTWREFKASFPKVNYLEKTRCPYLSFFPCDHGGIWRQS